MEWLFWPENVSNTNTVARIRVLGNGGLAFHKEAAGVLEACWLNSMTVAQPQRCGSLFWPQDLRLSFAELHAAIELVERFRRKFVPVHSGEGRCIAHWNKVHLS